MDIKKHVATGPPDSNLAVVQILYYPTGFKMGDNHLRVMPGSHQISAFRPELEGPELQCRGDRDHETTLKEVFGLSTLGNAFAVVPCDQKTA